MGRRHGSGLHGRNGEEWSVKRLEIFQKVSMSMVRYQISYTQGVDIKHTTISEGSQIQSVDFMLISGILESGRARARKWNNIEVDKSRGFAKNRG
jgi:hypothetical protein